MTELFTSASKTLRDEVVSELKNQNNFLRNNFQGGQPDSFLTGCRVKVLPYQDMGRAVLEQECEGIYVKFIKYSPLILLKRGDQVILRMVPLSQIIFMDSKITKLFD